MTFLLAFFHVHTWCLQKFKFPFFDKYNFKEKWKEQEKYSWTSQQLLASSKTPLHLCALSFGTPGPTSKRFEKMRSQEELKTVSPCHQQRSTPEIARSRSLSVQPQWGMFGHNKQKTTFLAEAIPVSVKALACLLRDPPAQSLWSHQSFHLVQREEQHCSRRLMEIASNTLHILTNGAVSSEMEVIGLMFPNHADSGAVGMQ